MSGIPIGGSLGMASGIGGGLPDLSIINEAHSLFIGKEQLREYLDGHFKKFTEHNYVIFSTKNRGSLHEFQVFFTQKLSKLNPESWLLNFVPN